MDRYVKSGAAFILLLCAISCNETMQMISSAIRALGADMIGEREKQILQEAIRKVPEKEFETDITIPPARAQVIMLDVWNRSHWSRRI